MAAELVALTIDANDPERLIAFWAELLGWERVADDDLWGVLVPEDDTGFSLRFQPTDAPNARQHQTHFDLTSKSLDHQQQTVARVLELGGRHLDIGQTPEEGHVVMADPEGNEFCIIEPGNNFLADCPFIGAVNGDGTQALGYFWSEALGWPLVWDEDEETAVRSPHGGPKFTWGGPPVALKVVKNRLRFDIRPSAGTDLEAEVDRLVSLGASRLNTGGLTGVAMADPDGNEFCVLPPR